MSYIKNKFNEYIEFCSKHKRLDSKTIKAYSIDIKQYLGYLDEDQRRRLSEKTLREYVALMNKKYNAKTVKRKIASLKAFVIFVEGKESVHRDLIRPLKIKFREPKKLPKIIPLDTIKVFFETIRSEKELIEKENKRKLIIRDMAVVELLFATGIRISELCLLRKENLDLTNETVRINGKGAKERILSISNKYMVEALKEYEKTCVNEDCDYYFVNNLGRQISDQSVRLMIKKYVKLAGLKQNITPHMFRHSFATLLLEQDVDIRYIQKMLGHSSITITEIYTFVSSAKQRDILANKNPRNLLI